MKIIRHIPLLITLVLLWPRPGKACQDPLPGMLDQLRTATDSEKVYIYSEISKYYLRSSLERSMEWAMKAKSLADSIGSERLRAEALNRIGSVHLIFHNTNKAASYILQALRIREKLKDSAAIAYSYTNLALLYAYNMDYDKAIEYNRRSIAIKKALGLEERIGANLNNMGVMYSYKEDWEKALEWSFKHLNFAKQHHITNSIQDSYLNIGSAYHKMRKLKEAEKYYLLAYHMAGNMQDTSALVQTLINLSGVYLDMHKPYKSYHHLMMVTPIVKEYGELQNLSDYYGNLAEYYRMTGDMRKAWLNKLEEIKYKDSLKVINSSDNLSNLQSEYEAEDLEYRIQSLQKNKIIEEMMLRKERRTIWASLAFFLLVVLLILNVIFAIRRLDRIRHNLDRKNRHLEEANRQLAESEKKLNAMVRTKDKFFSIIAHDLINPFQPLLGLSELLVTDIDRLNDDEIRKYAGMIKESAMRSYNLLSNLLKWTQSQTGRLAYNPENLYLWDILEEILSFYKENARIKNIHLLNHVDKDLVVHADRELLSAILRNLISNAIKFTGRNGYIKVEAHPQGDEVEIRVQDNGIGIDEKKLKKLFELESASSTRGTENEEGSGLGLILCREFVEKNGGRIWAESKKGKGSTFRFTVPAAKSAEKKEEKA